MKGLTLPSSGMPFEKEEKGSVAGVELLSESPPSNRCENSEEKTFKGTPPGAASPVNRSAISAEEVGVDWRGGKIAWEGGADGVGRE